MRVLFHVPYPLNPDATTASGIRPVKMRQAFIDLGHQVWTVSGTAAQRKRQMRRIRTAVANGERIDLAYSESSTMPTSMTEPHHLPLHPVMDLKFLGDLKRAGVPVGLFYRDVYWRRDDYAPDVAWPKRQAALAAYRLDLALYQRNLSVLFLPSELMAREIPEISLPIAALPPGHDAEAPAPVPSEGVRLLYVGGTGLHYRMDALLQGVHLAVRRGADVRFTLCTREGEWRGAPERVRALAHGPVEVVHASGAELAALYAAANVASLYLQPNPYRDFAMPVKLFEYLGQGRPVLATEATKAAEVIADADAGWVLPYDAGACADLLGRLSSHPAEIAAAARRTRAAGEQHTWTARAQTVVATLTKAPQRRVLMVSAAASIHTARWANALADAGWDVHLASVHEPNDQTYDPAVTLHRLPPTGPQPYVTAAPALALLMRRLRPDLVHAHYATGYGTLARLALKGAPRVGYLLSVWGSDIYEAPHQGAAKRRMVVANLRAADLVASTSHAMAAEIATYVTKPTVITPFGIDVDVFSPEDCGCDSPRLLNQRAGAGLRIGTVKAMQHLYGIDVLIAAFARADATNALGAEATLHLWGRGPDQPIFEQQARDLGLGERVFFHGAIPHDQVPEALCSLDIFCALSRDESFGVAALEAMACGVPVVVSDADGLAEVTVPEAGIVVPRTDVGAAAAALTRLAENPALRDQLGRAGRTHVVEHYSWQASVDAMLAAYDQLLQATAPRRP